MKKCFYLINYFRQDMIIDAWDGPKYASDILYLIVAQLYCHEPDIKHGTYKLPPLLNSAPANHLIGRINSSCGDPVSSPINNPKTHIYFLHGVDFINQDKITTEEKLGKKCFFYYFSVQLWKLVTFSKISKMEIQ